MNISKEEFLEAIEKFKKYVDTLPENIQEDLWTILNFLNDELEEQTEANKELNKVIITYKAMINEMAKELYIEGYCKNIKCKKCEAKNFVECIIDYYFKKVSDNK